VLLLPSDLKIHSHSDEKQRKQSTYLYSQTADARAEVMGTKGVNNYWCFR